ncbi:MAG: NAD-dependent epimerase/dehydratase family protein [Sandaracinaceae bacterium]|nr:NAD-dependent epimerase/dehydratase family protein [Sandaracinaceae bacterium]
MKVLVLGATGFIGGAIARRLAAQGHDVRALCRDASRFTGDARDGDLGDPASIAAAAQGCDVVVNAAGIVDPDAHPRALRWTHVAGMENLLKACRHVSVARLVHVSCTDVTLANHDRVHWDELKPVPGEPFGPRAQSLQLAEDLTLSASDDRLATVALRAAWVWGPGDTSRLPQLCAEGLDGGIRLVGDGRTYLATTYVEHLVDAALAALDAPDAPGRAYHVVDPVFQHARDFFGALSEALGLPRPRDGAPFAIAWPIARVRGRGAVELLQRGKSTLFDFSQACGKLHYDPQISLEDGLAATARWVEAEGGVAAIAARRKPPPGASAVDRQVAAAGGD